MQFAGIYDSTVSEPVDKSWYLGRPQRAHEKEVDAAFGITKKIRKSVKDYWDGKEEEKGVGAEARGSGQGDGGGGGQGGTSGASSIGGSVQEQQKAQPQPQQAQAQPQAQQAQPQAQQTSTGMRTCGACGTTAPRMKRCSRCLAAWYCSPQCQAAAWKEHRKACAPKQA